MSVGTSYKKLKNLGGKPDDLLGMARIRTSCAKNEKFSHLISVGWNGVFWSQVTCSHLP